MKTLMLFLALALACVPVRSDELPEKPHRVVDKKFVVASAMLAGAWAVDMKTTNDGLHRCPGCVELGWFDHGGRNVPKIAGEWALFDAGVVIASYELKKHLHGRILGAAWIAPIGLRIETHASMAAENEKY